MGTSLDVIPLEESQLEEAADVLARAFWNDPFAVYILPEEDTRDDLLFWYFGVLVQYGLLYGAVDTTSASAGVAVWLPHYGSAAGPQYGLDRLRESGLLDAPDVLGHESFSRLMQVTGHLDRLRRAAVPLDHWYLPTVGVDPSQQGRGIGSALLRHAFARADADQIPCYLETFAESTVPFYRRHGFGQVAESVVPRTELQLWTFRRDPGRRPAVTVAHR